MQMQHSSARPDSDSVGLLDLPDELLYHIALQLPVSDICSVSLLSREIYALLNHNAFWQLMCEQNHIIVADYDGSGDSKSIFRQHWNGLLCVGYNPQRELWETYELQSGLWSEPKIMSQLSEDCTNCVCRAAFNRIYVLLEDNKLWQYNPLNDEFHLYEQSTELPGAHSMCYDNGVLYGVGDSTPDIYARNVHTAEAEWRVIGSLHQRDHSYPAIAVIVDKLYVCSSSGAECFDLKTGRLCEMAQIEMENYPAYCVYQGKLWLGIVTPSSYELVCYDPKSNLWTHVSTVPTRRKFAVLTVHKHRLWMIAGASAPDDAGAVCESYDVVTDTWRTECPLPGVIVNGVCAAV
eukprot:TRINITY_DN2251_c0_g2_i1.p1 TRINITY_DN2251_c0_g2~~TRINITY_DN2251_c0_g2_i1.p1  ORF type:complete len:349 (-),score=31.24 TRINITY_DN2251_c0_g2_i1:40-1086(-)